MGVIGAYRSLNAEQKQIIKQKTVSMNRPVDEILAVLRPIASCDALVSKAGKFGCTGGLMIPLIVVALILNGNQVFPTAVGITIVVLLIGVMIASFVLYGWARSIDVNDGLSKFALPMLALFREDFEREKPVSIKLDLRAPTDKAKCQTVGKEYKKGAYHKIIDSIYKDEWFSGEAPLADGSRLRWDVTDTILERKKTKRNARGKYKSKTKYKKRTMIDVSVTLKKKRYALDGTAEDQKVQEADNAHTVRMRRRLQSTSLDPVALDPFVDAVAGIYRNARPVK